MSDAVTKADWIQVREHIVSHVGQWRAAKVVREAERQAELERMQIHVYVARLVRQAKIGAWELPDDNGYTQMAIDDLELVAISKESSVRNSLLSKELVTHGFHLTRGSLQTRVGQI